ncbi:YbaB/EbfC family nucleoid-associated protein [Candidatus Dojkabacteria bacterium]|nr:YbaB/EbfC family nucleoid-associated protein [Candidatus Dojkabacteria bacterium]
MNVFSNVSDLMKLRKEAKTMQKKMQEQKLVGESKNRMIKFYMNAAQELEDVFINDEWLSKTSADDVKKCIKEAFRDYTKKLQKTMASSFDMDQLKGMMGM